MPLTPDQMREALHRITAWRLEPAKQVACPACGAAGLTIIDRSARPHAEWYALACPACGLDETVHIPMGAAIPGVD